MQIWSFFYSDVGSQSDLESLRNTENEANFLLPLGIQKRKGFQLRGPLTSDVSAWTCARPWPCDFGNKSAPNLLDPL